jgi:hypothetical protein
VGSFIETKHLGRMAETSPGHHVGVRTDVHFYGMVPMPDAGAGAPVPTEHHFQHEGYEVTPNLILFGLHLAGMTERLRFGQMFNMVPQWHPLRSGR